MLRVCRVCLAEIGSECGFFRVNTVEEHSGFMPIRDKLTLVVPEMALDLVVDPVICVPCKKSLQVAYNFKQQCLSTDKRLHKTMKYTTLENGCLKLDSVMHMLKSKDELMVVKKDKKGFQAKIKCVNKTRTVEDANGDDEQDDNELETGDVNIIIAETLHNDDNEDLKLDNSTGTQNTTQGDDKDNEIEITDTMVEVNFSPCEAAKHEAATIGPMVQCKLCQIKLLQTMNLKQHLRIHLKGSAHLCNFCGIILGSKYLLGMHLQTHDVDNLISCTKCNKVFTDFELYKKHTQKDHTDQQEEEEPSEDPLLENMEGKIDEVDPIQTNPDMMEDNFIPFINLESKSKMFMCKICSCKLLPSADLHQHLKNHQTGPNHECYVCNRKFKARHYLKRHEKTHYANVSTTYTCQTCHKGFKDRLSFKRHTHDGTGQVVKQNKNRSTLPKEAKQIMKKWLYTHQDNPYPTDSEKQELVHRTKLKYIQVENWFVNARRRILHKTRDYFVNEHSS